MQWAAWTGGEPTEDWTGLNTPKPTSIGPNQYRPASISGQAKAQYYRTQGLETKFTRDGDLQVFQKKVLEHLVTYGLDTIAYLSHPKEAKTVVLVIEHHALFQLKDGVKMAMAEDCSWCCCLFVECDRTNGRSGEPARPYWTTEHL